MHVAVAGKTHNLRRHLGVRGVCALPDFGFAALHGDRTVEVQLHTVRRRFQRNRVNRGVVPECCHADAAADRSGLVLIFFELPVVVNCRTTLFHALAERVIVVDVVREAVFKTLGHDEFVAVLDRIHTHGARALFDVRIVCKRRLRHAVARALRLLRGGWCRPCRHRLQSFRTDRSAGTSPSPWRRSSDHARRRRPGWRSTQSCARQSSRPCAAT